MLLKWAVEGKRRSRLREAFRTPHIDNDSICTVSSSDSFSEPFDPPESSCNVRTTTVSKGLEATDPGKSKITMQRLVSEEQAIIVRDEKLLAASNPDPRQLSISMPPTPSSYRVKLPTPALTVENTAIFRRGLEINPFDLFNFNAPNDHESDSDGSTNQGSSPEAEDVQIERRRELERNSSSDITVKPRKKRLYR